MQMETQDKTKEVETLLGDPKKAILAMAVPIVVAMLAQSVNKLADAVWVSSLGPDALAAVGIVFPLFFILIAFSNGIGVGAASAISKRIGAENKEGADKTATHAIVLIAVISIFLTIALAVFLDPLLRIMGAGATESTLRECMDYAWPMIISTPIFLFIGVLSSILRSEGAAKRSMYILILAAIINLALDPIFIYDFGLGWGIAGAAWATVVGESIALIAMFYWYFVKKNLYLKFKFKGFRFEMPIIKDIFRVGLPASMQMMILSVVSIFMNLILLKAGGDDGVAIYSSDWRIINMLSIPLMGIASGLVPVCAAAFGARRYDKIKIAYVYSLKISVASMIIISVVTVIFAPQMLTVFTYDASTEYLRDGMAEFMRIACLFLPFMAMGMAAESLFQALGMGMKALISTLFRNFLMLPIAYFLMVTSSGLTSIWWGISISEIVGSLFIVVWSALVLREIMKVYNMEKRSSVS